MKVCTVYMMGVCAHVDLQDPSILRTIKMGLKKKIVKHVNGMLCNHSHTDKTCTDVYTGTIDI